MYAKNTPRATDALTQAVNAIARQNGWAPLEETKEAFDRHIRAVARSFKHKMNKQQADQTRAPSAELAQSKKLQEYMAKKAIEQQAAQEENRTIMENTNLEASNATTAPAKRVRRGKGATQEGRATVDRKYFIKNKHGEVVAAFSGPSGELCLIPAAKMFGLYAERPSDDELMEAGRAGIEFRRYNEASSEPKGDTNRNTKDSSNKNQSRGKMH